MKIGAGCLVWLPEPRVSGDWTVRGGKTRYPRGFARKSGEGEQVFPRNEIVLPCPDAATLIARWQEQFLRSRLCILQLGYYVRRSEVDRIALARFMASVRLYRLLHRGKLFGLG